MTVEQECNDKPAGRLYVDGAEMDQFVRSQNERFDIAALMIKMKNAAKAVLEENPAIATKTAMRTGWKLPEIAALAQCVLAHRGQVGSCIEQRDAAGAAAHAIQLDRAYQAMMFHTTKPVVDYGVEHMHPWREHWIDATDTDRKILDCIGGRERVPLRELLAATGASRDTLDVQCSRLNKRLRPLGYELQQREEFVNVTYTRL